MNDKEFQKCLEENIKKENFEKINLSNEDIIKILTDEKGYIREKLGVSRNELTETIKPIEINKDAIEKITEEIMNKYKNK